MKSEQTLPYAKKFQFSTEATEHQKNLIQRNLITNNKLKHHLRIKFLFFQVSKIVKSWGSYPNAL